MSYRIKTMRSGKASYLTKVEATDMGATCYWTDEDNKHPLEFPDRKRALGQARIWGPGWRDIVKVVKMAKTKKWPVEA